MAAPEDKPDGKAAGKAVVDVRHNAEEHRYEAYVDGQLAGFAEYRQAPGRLVFTHTEVDDAYEGKGVGSQLAAGALDDVRAQGSHAEPVCPFIKSYIDRHPAYADLVTGA